MQKNEQSSRQVETLLLDANGRRIIANSEFMILLKQAKSDREELVHLLGLSKELEKYLVNPEKGAGLIKAGSTVVPFRNKIPLQTQLFDIMSTDPEKMRAEQRQESNRRSRWPVKPFRVV